MVAVRGAPTLVRICDLAGRLRGTGFLADTAGTVLTSHEAVDGLTRAVVHAPPADDGTPERSRLAEASDITALPEWDLALVRAEGLGAAPLVLGAERPRPEGVPVRLWAGAWLEARLTGACRVTYTSTERYHPLEDVLELALPEATAVQLRLSRQASGTPVLDARTGAVLGVLGTALHAERPAGTHGDGEGAGAAYAVPLGSAALWERDGPLGQALARNGAAVPGFGVDLNLAGALQLTATSVADAVERAGRPVARPEVADAFRDFTESRATVVALVGEPGTGRTTELAALAARRARGVAPAPTVWLRGAALRTGDDSVRDAVARALEEAGRIVAASGGTEGAGVDGAHVGDPRDVNPDVVARLARDAGRPLLVLLDAPEEMPVHLAHELRHWTAGTGGWLRAAGARMAIACRPEYWEHAGALFPADMLYSGPDPTGADGGRRDSGLLPPCVRLGGLLPGQAARARTQYGLLDGALSDQDAAHPLALRMLAEVRDAMAGGDGGPANGRAGDGCSVPSRAALFSAHLDLVSLRIAVRLAAEGRPMPPGNGTAVRRLAAFVSGQLHEAARRCLGPGEGRLDREGFEEVFPWGGGWASAVLAEGILVPAGDGYRFADEEFADWLQGRHLDLEAALDGLVHRRGGDGTAVPVPRHRIGPVVQALLLCGRCEGPEELSARLGPLVAFCGTAGEAGWWAAHLLGETLLRVPDARPYGRVLRALAERVTADAERAADGPGGHQADGAGEFGPWFWRRLPLPAAERLELLRVLLPADGPRRRREGSGGERFLDAAGGMLAADPAAVQPLLCEWFSDQRPLWRQPDEDEREDRAAGPEPGTGGRRRRAPTVAEAAQALLHTHRHPALDQLTEVLLDAEHPRADELLAELAHDEPSALCSAVDRWAHSGRAERHTAAALFGMRAAQRAGSDEDRRLLRTAALTLLCRSAENDALRGPALALLVRDPVSRGHHLDAAVRQFAATGERELAGALGAALATHPEVVLVAFQARLQHGVRDTVPGASQDAVARDILRALAEVRTPAIARRAALLVREYAELCPDGAEDVAGFIQRRLAHGPVAHAVIRPLVTELLRDRHARLRASLAGALGGGAGALRDELLETLLETERDPAVLDAALCGVVRREPEGAGRSAGEGDLVRRIGLLMSRTAEGAAEFDRRLVGLAREVPGFAGMVREWTEGAPADWTAVVGPSAQRMCEALSERG